MPEFIVLSRLFDPLGKISQSVPEPEHFRQLKRANTPPAAPLTTGNSILVLGYDVVTPSIRLAYVFLPAHLFEPTAIS